MPSLFDEHRISLIGGKRYYEYDVGKPLPMDLENTSPYCFELRGHKIYDTSWGQLTLKILTELDAAAPKTQAELLSLEYSFSDATPFKATKERNHLPFKTVFLNVNHTSPHSLGNIQMLLKAYGVSFDECRLWIRRRYKAEPEEIKQYVTKTAKRGYCRYLAMRGMSEKSQKNMLGSIEFLNKTLVSVAKNYESFFLFDNALEFCNYKSLTLKEFNSKYLTNEKMIGAAKKCLDYYYEYLKDHDFYDNFDFQSVSPAFSDALKKELATSFTVLKTSVLHAKKFFNRVRICLASGLKNYPPLNDCVHLFAYMTHLENGTYFFKYPFITKEKNQTLTEDEVLTEFVFSQDEVSVRDFNSYADKMCLKKPNATLDFFLSLSDDYMLVDKGRIERISLLGIDEDQIEAVGQALRYCLSSYKEFDSEKNTYYGFLPTLGFEWNKESILGFVKCFLSDEIDVEILNIRYSELHYVLRLKTE